MAFLGRQKSIKVKLKRLLGVVDLLVKVKSVINRQLLLCSTKHCIL